MKKLNAKFIATAVIASMVASAASISASAAINYGYAPYYPPAVTVPTTSPSTSSDTQAATTTTPATPATDDADEKDEGASVAGESTVEEAIKNGGEVKLSVNDNGDAVVQEAAIAAIVKGDKPVTFDVDTDDGVDYSITIDPKSIKDAKAINLGMVISVEPNSTEVEGADVPSGAILIYPAQKGEFGMTLNITIPASELKGINIENCQLYYVSDDGELSLVEDAISVNKDGSITVSISHASYYVVTDVDLEKAVDDLKAALDELKEGLEGLIPDDDDADDTAVSIDQGKDDTSVVVNGGNGDTNPVTGTTLALGSLAVFAAAAVATSKKRK